MDHKLMKKEGVTHIVNTATGLDKMWPQWAAAEARNEEELGIEILRLPWLDANDQQLEVRVLMRQRDRARERDREAERQTDRQRDRQKDRANGATERLRDMGQRDRERDV